MAATVPAAGPEREGGLAQPKRLAASTTSALEAHADGEIWVAVHYDIRHSCSGRDPARGAALDIACARGTRAASAAVRGTGAGSSSTTTR